MLLKNILKKINCYTCGNKKESENICLGYNYDGDEKRSKMGSRRNSSNQSCKKYLKMSIGKRRYMKKKVMLHKLGFKILKMNG